MTPAISVAALSRRYRGQLALDDISFDIECGSITGLLGRNGAGKTTLMRILAGQEFASAGSVSILGASPVENDEILRRMVFVREDQAYPTTPYNRYLPGFRVRHALQAASWFCPNWDAELAGTLAGDFSLPLGRGVRQLSRGMRSALGIVIGLAARAEVTLFDEPYAGLDPVARQLFYDRLLADYAAHPRTVLLSTHLIDEAAGLLERVVVIDSGKLLLDATADEVRGSATSVSGPAIAVAEFTAGRTIWNRRRIGSQESAVVAGVLDEADRHLARTLRLNLESLTLQQVVVHAAGKHEAGARERTSATRAGRAGCPREGDRRLGHGSAFLPRVLHSGRAVVPHLAHIVGLAGPDVRVRHVVRADLPALEPARRARLHCRPACRRAGRGDRREPRTCLGVYRPHLH
jgi:ABC-2 type transport system ATP-binding protein